MRVRKRGRATQPRDKGKLKQKGTAKIYTPYTKVLGSAFVPSFTCLLLLIYLLSSLKLV